MDVQNPADRFDEAVAALPARMKLVLRGIPRTLKANVQEVRLRVNRPLALCCPGKNWFVDEKSQLHNIPRYCLTVTQEELAQSVVSMCAYSVHSHQHELAEGYLSLKGGHRAGICGTAVVEKGKITAVRDITSINIRIAREVHGAAGDLVNTIFKESLCGMLIVGVPSSGKTTILRDLARQLASGAIGRHVKVAVVDERCELGATYDGIPQNDLGACSDILSGYPKGQGILTAVRTLSPEVIICDEIGGREEADSMLDGVGCGVKMIAAAHAGSLDELLGRHQICRLLKYGAFDKIVMLENGGRPGVIAEIVEAGELSFEDNRDLRDSALLQHDRDVPCIQFVKEGIPN